MQITSAMRYQLTLVKMTVIKKKKKNLQTINAGENVERREPSGVAWGRLAEGGAASSPQQRRTLTVSTTSSGTRSTL